MTCAMTGALAKHILLLLAFALDPAAMANPDPSSQSGVVEPSGIPAPFLQPLMLDQAETVAQGASPASDGRAAPERERPHGGVC
jgi:hypothetical protein